MPAKLSRSSEVEAADDVPRRHVRDCTTYLGFDFNSLLTSRKSYATIGPRVPKLGIDRVERFMTDRVGPQVLFADSESHKTIRPIFAAELVVAQLKRSLQTE